MTIVPQRWTRRLCLGGLSGLLVAIAACSDVATGADTLAQIRQRGYLKIGTSGTAPPNSWVNSHNELIGYDIDWGNMIGRELRLPVRWVKTDFRGLMPALAAGQLDLVITGVRIREQLKRVFLFSEPYSYERMVAVVRKADSSMQRFDDIEGRRVAVVAASFQEDAVRQMGGYSELLSMPSGSDVFLCLHTGHADVAVVGLTAAVHYLHAGHDDVRFVSYTGGLNAQGIVMQKTAIDLKAAIDRIVAARRADGTYAALYRKNFGFEPLR
jgi:cystine transport system substrate-binding protein